MKQAQDKSVKAKHLPNKNEHAFKLTKEEHIESLTFTMQTLTRAVGRGEETAINVARNMMTDLMDLVIELEVNKHTGIR